MYSFHHSYIIVCIFATPVQGIQHSKSREKLKHFLPVACCSVHWVVYQIQLQQILHELQLAHLLYSLYFVGA